MSIWQIPDGIYELSGTEARKIEFNKRKLIDYYLENDYELVLPPLVNFASHNASFKFNDSISNKTLEIVSDMTKQIAIIDARNNNNQINQYCYINQIIKPHADDFYSSRAPIQVGAEIYGDDSLFADIKIIQTAIKSLNLLGIDDMNITVGNLSILNEVIKYFNLENNTSIIKEIFTRRSTPDLIDFIDENNLNCKAELLSLISGDLALISDTFKGIMPIEKEITKIIHLYDELEYINIIQNIGDSKTYNYHNGLIFSIYKKDFSKAIARGGRYDNLFNNRAATGFSFDLKFINSKLNK